MTATPVEITTVGVASAELLATLHRASFAQSAAESWSMESVCSLLASPGMLALVATHAPAEYGAASRPCGLAVARCGPEDAEILALGVLPHRRRRGIATSLLGALLRLFASTDIRKVLLEVAVDNYAARRLYATQGFSEIGLRRGYYRRRPGPPIDALVLARPVSPVVRPVAPVECPGRGPASAP